MQMFSESHGKPRRVLLTISAAAALCLATTLCSVQDAHAQGAGNEKAATAQTLYEEAMKAMTAKDYKKACPQLESVIRLVPEGVGAKLALAECYEADGRLASAYGVYVGAEGQARRAGQTDRADLARTKMDALKPRVATVTLDVPADVKGLPGFALKRDGAAVADYEYGLPISLDRGEHTFVATADGRAPWEKKISVEDGKSAAIKIEIGAATAAGTTPPTGTAPSGTAPSGMAPTGTAPTGTTPTGTAPPIGATDTAGEGSFFGPGRIAGLTIGLVGLVSVGAGIGVGMSAKGKFDRSNEEHGCNPENSSCPTQAGVALRKDAITFGKASTGLVIAGGILAAGGVVLMLVTPGADPEPATAGERAPEVRVGVGPGSVTVFGTF